MLQKKSTTCEGTEAGEQEPREEAGVEGGDEAEIPVFPLPTLDPEKRQTEKPQNPRMNPRRFGYILVSLMQRTLFNSLAASIGGSFCCQLNSIKHLAVETG